MLAPVRPPFDPELDETLKEFPFSTERTFKKSWSMLSNMNATKVSDSELSDSELDRKDITIPGWRPI
jgi:hypothetical protein